MIGLYVLIDNGGYFFVSYSMLLLKWLYPEILNNIWQTNVYLETRQITIRETPGSI